MSRSYKKSPYWTYNKASKVGKRLASRKVRRYLSNLENHVPNKLYKKVFESYKICDACCRWTKQEAIQSYEEDLRSYYNGERKDKPEKRKYIHRWRQSFYRK